MPHRPLLLACLSSAMAILASCGPATFSAPGATASTRPFTRPADEQLPGLTNFAKVSPILYRGAQPDAEGFANLKKLGVKTVINLREAHSDLEMLRGTGMRYLHFPCAADRIDQDDIAVVIKVLRDPANQPVFIHCQHGSDRTGLAVGIYRIVEEGWTADEAEVELRAFKYHGYYKHVLETIRLLSKTHFNRIVEKTDVPKFENVR